MPEHHHHFHEKEKIIIETKKEEHDPIYPPLKEDEVGHLDHYDFASSEQHNVYKKHVRPSTSTTTVRSTKSAKSKHKRKRRYRVHKS